MIKIDLDDLRPETRPKIRQKLEGILHKAFVPPGQTVSGKLYLFRRSEAIGGKHPAQTSRQVAQQLLDPCIMTTLRLTRRSLCGSFWLLRVRRSSPTLLNHRTSPPVIFFSYSRRWNWNSEVVVLTALKRYRPNRMTWWRRWREMTSSFNVCHPRCACNQ